MPKVWTLRQRGIRSPAPPARAAEARARADGSGAWTATGTRHDATSARGRLRNRRGAVGNGHAATSPAPRTPPPEPRRDLRESRTCSIRRSSANPRPRRGPPLRTAEPIGKDAPLGRRRARDRSERRAEGKWRQATRRGNYESGSDYVLEYGELRFSFNEDDFSQRVEQAAVKLDFVDQGLDARRAPRPARARRQRRDPRADLGARRAHQRALDRARRPRQPQPRPLDPPARVPRRLARPAGQGGRARHRLRPRVHHSFGYVQPDRDAEPIELSREPSWAGLAYRR